MYALDEDEGSEREMRMKCNGIVDICTNIVRNYIYHKRDVGLFVCSPAI